MVKKCGIILYNKNNKKYFLVHGRKSNKWGFPKGHMEKGETEKITALREFYEETGFQLSPLIELNKKYIVKNNIYFQVSIENLNELIKVEDTIPDRNEIEKYEWFFIEEILRMNIKYLNFGLKTFILNKKYEENI
jgi:tRNA nucleotidyltransferase (CCA-adding enzyme)